MAKRIKLVARYLSYGNTDRLQETEAVKLHDEVLRLQERMEMVLTQLLMSGLLPVPGDGFWLEGNDYYVERRLFDVEAGEVTFHVYDQRKG